MATEADKNEEQSFIIDDGAWWDKLSLAAPCCTCLLWHPLEYDFEWNCDAFPDGIPMEVRRGQNLHKSPIAGDKGIQYERRPPTEGDAEPEEDEEDVEEESPNGHGPQRPIINHLSEE